MKPYALGRNVITHVRGIDRPLSATVTRVHEDFVADLQLNGIEEGEIPVLQGLGIPARGGNCTAIATRVSLIDEEGDLQHHLVVAMWPSIVVTQPGASEQATGDETGPGEDGIASELRPGEAPTEADGQQAAKPETDGTTEEANTETPTNATA